MKRRVTVRLSTRLAMAFGLGTACVLAGTGWSLDRTLEAQLRQRDEAELLGNLTQLRHVLDEHASVDELRADPHVLRDAVMGHEGASLALLDASGSTLLELGPWAPRPAVTHRVSLEQVARPQDVQEVAVDGARWRVVAATAALAAPAAAPVQVVLARSLADHDTLQRRFRQALLAAVIAAAALTALYAWVVTSRGVRPLAMLATMAQRISANRLDERIELSSSDRETVELVQAFNAMTERLQEAFGRLARFSDDLAHDFKTPLANLVAHTEVMLARPRSAAELRGLHESNLEEYGRLARMIDDMLFLARADNAQVALVREPVDVGSELRRLAEFFEPLAADRGVELAVEGSATAPADRLLLSRAVANLLSNAIRHADAGSTVRIAVRVEAGSQCVICVRNAGPGIEPSDLPHVFDRFWRSDRARPDSHSSTGLGLSIVRSIMQLHAGLAEVRSHPGQWTEFSLRFPA